MQPVNGIMGGLMDNIIKVPEDNWNIVDSKTDIWNGSLPYIPGTKFPTSDIKERAEISKTNRMIYNNDVEMIYSNVLSILPETDPIYGWQIREIIASLPYFKNATNAWVSLIAGDAPLVDVEGNAASDDDDDLNLSRIIENCNFAEMVQNEVRSRFMDIISAYRVDVNINGKPVIVAIEPKNLICFVNKDMPSSIEVNVIFSIYKNEEGEEFVDFVEYHYNGLIRKTTYHYEDGTIGELANDPVEEYAFGGKYEASPVVVFKHNVVGNEIYGTDQFRYWSASILAGMREFQNVLRLGERTREMIRKVPNTAIKKNPVDGSSTFYNKGTIGYNEGADKSPDIEYVVPEIRMDEAIKALDSAVRQIGLDTQLSAVYLDPGQLGSRLSADSIRAAMFPAMAEAKRMVTEIKPSLKELVTKLGYLADLDISSAKLTLQFYDGFPKDEKIEVETIKERLESTPPTISQIDAIMRLDRISLRAATERARVINQQSYVVEDKEQSLVVEEEEETKIDEIDNTSNIIEDELVEAGEAIVNTHEIRPTAGIGETETATNVVDGTVWENQLAFPPRDQHVGGE